MLGFLPDAAYEELELPVAAGDRLLLYTDGLPEAANAAEEFFDLERVKAALVAGSAFPSDAAADALLQAMDAWSGQPATRRPHHRARGQGELVREDSQARGRE